MDNQNNFIDRINKINDLPNRAQIQNVQEIANVQRALLDSVDLLAGMRSIEAARNSAQNITQLTSNPALESVFSIAATSQTKLVTSAMAHHHSIIPKFEIPQELIEYQKMLQEQLSIIGQPWFSEKIDFTPLQTTIGGVLKDHLIQTQTAASAMVSMQPAIDIAKSFSSHLNSIPNMDFRIKNFASELSDIVAERSLSIEDIYYPSKEEIDEFISDNFQNKIATDTLPDKEQNNQNKPDNHPASTIDAKQINESIHKKELLSNMADPWWHVSFVFSLLYEILWIGIIGYVTGQLDFAQFVIFFNSLIKLFNLK